jgi:ribonuclease P protein subunit POP4
VYDIPAAQRRYEIYEPLHALWCAYIREVLGLQPASSAGGGGRTYVDGNGAGPMLASADYHGARLEVVRSRCVSRVGLQGIVVKDNKFSFELVTRRNEVKLVPKEHTVFRFEVPFQEDEQAKATDGQEGDMTVEASEGKKKTREPLIFEIHGSQFETRAPDRATKKFRLHFDADL